MREIQVSELSAVCEQPRTAQLIDVRSIGEFAAGHVPGAVNIPLEEIERRLCKGGTRARIAAECLKDKLGNLTVLQGGADAWAKTRLPLVVSAKSRWALERQVRLAAGLLVLSSVVLSLTVYPALLYLAGLVG